jgi:hypothetical protein
MTPAQMEIFRAATDIRPGHECAAFEGLREPAADLQAFLDRVPFAAAGEQRLQAKTVAVHFGQTGSIPDPLPALRHRFECDHRDDAGHRAWRANSSPPGAMIIDAK